METGSVKTDNEILTNGKSRPVSDGTRDGSREFQTEVFMQRLLDEGLIREIKPPVTDPSQYQDEEPLEVKGQPLSEIIIEERQ